MKLYELQQYCDCFFSLVFVFDCVLIVTLLHLTFFRLIIIVLRNLYMNSHSITDLNYNKTKYNTSQIVMNQQIICISIVRKNKQ